MRVSTVPKLTTYVHTLGFTSEYFKPQPRFPISEAKHRNAWCDSCEGRIGGPRLLCLDCSSKNTEMYDSVDLCCASQCVDARITKREDLESAHEPSHRLFKVRTPVLTRNEGRAITGACEAFQRVRELCTKIAASSSQPHKMAGLYGQQTPSSEPTLTETHAKGDNLDDNRSALDCSKGGAEMEVKPAPDAVQGQASDQGFPTCGKCESGLFFPFWYCIFCEGASRGRFLSP